jgi:hypothetical protein
MMMVRRISNQKGGSLAMKMKISDVAEIIKNANEDISKAIEQFKEENPGVDAETLLSGQLSRGEVGKFVNYAKEQGVKMPYDSIEMGILAAGRRDMQNGLTEILNAIDPGRPTCAECDEEMWNRGRGKKKL